MQGTPYEESFTTYNYSVPGAESDERDRSINYHFEGVDGLKTGSSPSGAFNIDMTAKRGDLRLIAIVFGVGDWADQTGEFKRHPFANAMLNYGFNNFEVKEILPAGEQELDERKIDVKTALVDTVKKGDTPKVTFASEETLKVENSLPQVTDKIAPVTGEFEEEQTIFSKKSKKDNKKETGFDIVDLSHPITKWVGIVMGIIILLMLILIIFLVRDNKKRKRARQNRRERNEELLK
jgi:D-alanyl-D-alanine carboxypeptidase